MQAIGVVADVIADRDVQLHGNLIVTKEQPVDLIHLQPVRDALDARDADMIPAALGARQNV